MQRLTLLAVTALAVFVLLAATSRAAEYPGQRPAPPIVNDLVQDAQVFWAQHGVDRCDNVTAWAAMSLLDTDGVDAWGRGDGATCTIWVTDDLVHRALRPAWLGDALDACGAVTHEVGHANGLGHTATGVMAGSGAPAKMFGWTPRFCFRWARSTMRAVLRGEGYTERGVRRFMAAEKRILHDPSAYNH